MLEPVPGSNHTSWELRCPLLIRIERRLWNLHPTTTKGLLNHVRPRRAHTPRSLVLTSRSLMKWRSNGNLWVVTCYPTAKSEWVSRFSLTSDGYDLIADNYTYWWWIQVSWIGQNASLGIMDWIYKFLNACQSSCIEAACKNLACIAVLNTSPSEIYTRNSFPYHHRSHWSFVRIDHMVVEYTDWQPHDGGGKLKTHNWQHATELAGLAIIQIL